MPFIIDEIFSEGNITGTTISATTILGVTFSGLPTDITVTGGTVSRTGNNTTLTFTNNTGGTFTVTPIIDTFVTGGTYSTIGGTLTFTNNSGNTFNVTGLTSSDTFTTGFTYSNNVFTIARNQGLPALTALINTMTGLTVNGNLIATTVSATTYQNLPIDIRVTGGTFSSTAGTATFTNNTGGTFNVTGFTTTTPIIKSNRIAAATFTGSPRRATVTFTTNFPSTGYSISVIGGDNRTFIYENQTVSGFTINTNANAALTRPVLWTAIQNGEY